MKKQNILKARPEKTDNAHPNYDLWNVSLWINNDMTLYSHCLELVQILGVKLAVKVLYRQIGNTSTPDGVRFTKRAIRYALCALSE